jgi:DNA-binding transcriptional regulator YdaS (Cro superfamily)
MASFEAMSETMPISEIISKAAGNPSKLARLLGITRQAVDQWKRVPVEHVLAVEEMSGIPRHVQRPDVYPPPREGENPTNRAAYQPAA